MTAKPNQGMRQPQLGGVLSRPLHMVVLHDPERHRRYWRAHGGVLWICEECHPPAREWRSIERREV